MGGEKETLDLFELNAALSAAAAGNLPAIDTESHPFSLVFVRNSSRC
jgi:hypothetical protein